MTHAWGFTSQGTLQPPNNYPRGPTYFIKRKAQRIIRKETQSTTIQIMRYVLLGCKVTSQALSTTAGTVLYTARSARSHCHTSTAQSKAHPACSCRTRPTTQARKLCTRTEVLLTSNQMGRFISFSTWQALVVTELTPEHHSTEKSQGWFTTYRLTEMLSWRYCLCRESRGQHGRQRGASMLSSWQRGLHVWDAIQQLQPRRATVWRARPRADLLARQRAAASIPHSSSGACQAAASAQLSALLGPCFCWTPDS